MNEEKTIELKVRKASLKNDSLVLEYEEVINDPEDGPVVNTYTLKGGAKPHEDLLKAFVPLGYHVAMICEQVKKGEADLKVTADVAGKEQDVTQILMGGNVIAQIEVTGFTLSGDDESEGIVLVAQRKLKSGKVLNLISPFTKWEDEYEGIGDLQHDIEVLLGECIEYIHGKHAPAPQMELEFPENEEEPEGATGTNG